MHPWARAGALLLVVAAGAAAALLVDLPDVAAVRTWLDAAGWAGLPLLALGTGIALLAPVPRSALSVLAGVVAGFPAGLAVTLAGGLLGALGAFALGRRLGRPAVERLAGPRLRRADRLLSAHGFGTLFAVRLSPISFTVVSYAAALSAVRTGTYTAATAVGLVPGSVLYVGAGASLVHLDELVDRLTSPPVLVAAAVTVVVAAAVLLGWWRRRRQ
ncbi:TVP38/TMEM64 family protein [Blastococcus sp. SYSU D00820]